MGALETNESIKKLREIEMALGKRLAANRIDAKPIDTKPVDSPMCPRCARPLKTVALNTRKCPACGRSELELIRKGVNIYPTSGCNKPAGTDETHAFLRKRELERKEKAQAAAQEETEARERDRQTAVNRALQNIHEPLVKDTLKVAREPRKIPIAKDQQSFTFGKGRKYTPDMRTMRG